MHRSLRWEVRRPLVRTSARVISLPETKFRFRWFLSVVRLSRKHAVGREVMAQQILGQDEE
jgi:hypothetical protein